MIDEYASYLEKKGYRKKTAERTKQEIERFYRYVGEGVDNSREKTIRYYDYIKNKGYKESTIGLKMQQIRGYFKYLKEKGHILKYSTEDIKLPKRNRITPYNIPTYKEIERLIDRIDTKNGRKTGARDRAILELFYTSGIRRRELVNLNIYDVDLKNGQVFIREGKGGKDRVAPIGKETVRWIYKYINGKRKRHIKDMREKALFLGKGTGLRLRYCTIDAIFEKYKPVRNSDRRISSHRLRHACAIGMLRNGADIRIVQRLLGHQRLTTTQIYTKLSPEDLKKFHKKYHPRTKVKKAL